MPVTAYLGLGANIGDVLATLEEAIRRLEDAPATRVVARARYYQTRPVGPPGQPDYVNTAVAIETELDPDALLAHVKHLEQALGRVPTVRWGPRAVDIDILLYGDRVVDTSTLTIPHVELANRRFVLTPLADLAPDVPVPRLGRTVGALLAALTDDPEGVRLMGDGPGATPGLDSVSAPE